MSDWIAVSERLPDKQGKYLTSEKRYTLNDEKHTGKYVEIVDYTEFDGYVFRRAKQYEVIAWMPLPTPYKESEE